jgi:hypothetical protein
MAFFVNVEAVPKPRWASEAASIGTVTFVHVPEAVKATPKLSPSVMVGWVNWNQ